MADSLLSLSLGYTNNLEKGSILLLVDDQEIQDFSPQSLSKFGRFIIASQISNNEVEGEGWTLLQGSIDLKDRTLTSLSAICSKAR